MITKIKSKFYLVVLIFLISCTETQNNLKTEHYSNGNVFKTYSLNSNGEKDGVEIIFFEDGKKKQKRVWSNGNVIDTIRTYNVKEQLVSKGVISNDNYLKLYDEDGLMLEGRFEKEGVDGPVRYFKNNKLIMSKTFKNDNDLGLNFVFNHSDSLTKPQFIYSSENGKRTGLLIDFHESGVIRSVRESDISDEGQYLKFNKNGTIKQIGYKVKGKLSGWIYEFDLNGKFLNKDFYVEGNVDKNVN